MRGFADDSVDDVSVVGDPEARGSPGGTPTVEASSVSSQASYLEAVSSAIATMPPDALRQSLEYVLPPVVRVLRAETEALVAGDTGASEPISTPKRRAARLEALESATRCVSLVVRRAGRCGATKEAALELFAALVSTLGKAVSSVVEAHDADRTDDVSESALEHVRLAALDALRAAMSAFDDDATVFLVDDERNLPILGYAISLLLDIARSEAERKKALGSRKVRRDALGALALLVDAAARGERMRNVFVEKDSPNTKTSPSRALAAPSALAFFLPGVVSGCARAIAASVGSRAGHGAGPASAAEDSAAAEFAAAALATTCRAALADADFVSFDDPRSKEARSESRTSDDAFSFASSSSANETLAEELRRLAKKKMADPESKVSSEGTLEAEDETKQKTLRVVRDDSWLSLAAPRVASAVSSAFAQLVTHTKPSTRAAAAIHALDVLETCGETLGSDARVALLSAALVVSSDPFPAAADRVDARLERLKKTKKTQSSFEPTLQRAFRESLVSMPKSVRDEAQSFDGTDARGSGGSGGAKARSARGALRLMDPEALADALLTDEGLRRDVAVSLVSCFEMEPTMARTENRRKANDDASREAESEKLFALRDKDDVARETRARRARWLVCPSRGEQKSDTTTHTVTVIPAPAPPPRARFVSDAGLFASVALLVRALGRNPVTLPALLETHLRAARLTLAEALNAEAEDAEDCFKTDAPSAADAWRRKARAHVAVAVELLLGAAEARVESHKSACDASQKRRLKAHTAKDSSSARNALEAFLGGGAWDLPTSPAAAAAAARALRRERREMNRRGTGRRDEREAQTTRYSSDEHENADSQEEEEYETRRGKKKRGENFSPRFSATARENGLLSCLLVEAVGCVALAFGTEFVTTGGFLPTALCPLLLKLGDDDDSVRETTEGVLFAVAREGGFLPKEKIRLDDDAVIDGDFSETDGDSSEKKEETPRHDVSAAVSALVSKNADYVVDALSRRLRRLSAFPDAARFFAAVLGSNPANGAARDLLPFLRDPIARAAEAISVTGRASLLRKGGLGAASSDDGACAFMQIMAQTSRAAAAEARAADDEIAEAIRALEPLVLAMAKRKKGTETEENDDDDNDASKSSFLESLSSTDVSSLTRSLPTLLASWRRRQTRLSRVSKLCAVMARASAPLAESGDSKRRRLASEALASSLRACGFLASSFASDKPVREILRALFPEEVPEDDSFPAEDRVVRVLPLVHEIWPHLVVATAGLPRGPSLVPAAFAASVDAINACAEVSQPGNGGFVSRRFLNDAWPGLLKALRHGVPSLDRKRDDITSRLERVALIDGKTMTASYEYAKNASSERLFDISDGIEPGTETTRASATVRTCVLSLLFNLASDERTREAMTDVAPFALAAAVPFAIGEADGEASLSTPKSKSRDDKNAFRVRARAIDAVTALAAVDRDAAWMELTSRATGRDDAPVPVAPRFVEENEEGAFDDRKKNGRESKGDRRALPRLPSFRDVSPVPKTRTAPGVADAAARLLAAVEGRAETEAKSY
jgi:hypothetical protein